MKSDYFFKGAILIIVFVALVVVAVVVCVVGAIVVGVGVDVEETTAGAVVEICFAVVVIA